MKRDVICMNDIIAVMGPSGAGKTTLANNLVLKNSVVIPRHTTTRHPRKDDEQGFYRYLTHDEYSKMYNEGLFLISSGDGKEIKKETGNFYGVLKSDCLEAFEKSDIILLFTSYKDILSLVNLNKAGFNVKIVNLTFTEIEKNMRKRLVGNSEREHTIEDINSRIKWALKDSSDYINELQLYTDITVYTDIKNIEETYQEVCKKLKLKI